MPASINQSYEDRHVLFCLVQVVVKHGEFSCMRGSRWRCGLLFATLPLYFRYGSAISVLRAHGHDGAVYVWISSSACGASTLSSTTSLSSSSRLITLHAHSLAVTPYEQAATSRQFLILYLIPPICFISVRVTDTVHCVQ